MERLTVEQAARMAVEQYIWFQTENKELAWKRLAELAGMIAIINQEIEEKL